MQARLEEVAAATGATVAQLAMFRVAARGETVGPGGGARRTGQVTSLAGAAESGHWLAGPAENAAIGIRLPA